MSDESENLSKVPTPDPAMANSFFPSPASLNSFTSSKTDLDHTVYSDPYQGSEFRVLMIATEERYMAMQNGKKFSTGNHPVEMMLPMYHLGQAGFEFDVATATGQPVKLEMWAMPQEDEAVQGVYNEYLPKLENPMKLSDVVQNSLGDDSPYIAVFIPGGHGVMLGLPDNEDLKKVLKWAVEKDKHIISLCHGPSALLAAGLGEDKEDFIFKGYKITVFPDAIDRQTPEIGYMPGHMPWYVGEKLKERGVEILNEDITGMCHQDRKLITGDSPYASNRLGQLAAEALLKEVSAV